MGWWGKFECVHGVMERVDGWSLIILFVIDACWYVDTFIWITVSNSGAGTMRDVVA